MKYLLLGLALLPVGAHSLVVGAVLLAFSLYLDTNVGRRGIRRSSPYFSARSVERSGLASA
jgi:hypothetical protein